MKTNKKELMMALMLMTSASAVERSGSMLLDNVSAHPSLRMGSGDPQINIPDENDIENRGTNPVVEEKQGGRMMDRQ